MYLKSVINLNTYAMKKLLFFTVLMIVTTVIYGQKSIDALFEKYAGREGFTTVTISGDLLKLARCLDDHNEAEVNNLPASITEIRVLAQEKDNEHVENFYKLVIDDIDLKNYDEFMRVKKSDQDLRMLVRSEGNKFREFLLIAGGEDNAIVQIKGNMTYGEARKFAKEAEKNHGLDIVANHN
jgi:hypothetical protein